jgi:chaperonin cofactor prefoldin
MGRESFRIPCSRYNDAAIHLHPSRRRIALSRARARSGRAIARRCSPPGSAAKATASQFESRHIIHRSPEHYPERQRSTDAQAPQVITNDEIPEHTPRVPSNAQKRPSGSTTAASNEVKRPPEYWKAQAQQLKNSMASLQRRIDVLNGSLHAALTSSDDQPVWNLREKEKERQLAELQAQMSDLQRRFEDMQEAARRQGYGSSVYDP